MEALTLSPTDQFKAVELLLHKYARQMLPRAMAVEPSIEHEDLFQMFSEVYVKCQAKFDPERGKFSTYLVNACFFEFNDWMEKRQKERTAVSPWSLEAHAKGKGGGSGAHDTTGEQRDLYSRLNIETEDEDADPCEAVSLKQQVRAGWGLSPDVLEVVKLLLAPSPALNRAFDKHCKALAAEGSRVPADITIRFVADFLGMPAKAQSAMRTELKDFYGIDFKGLKR